MKTDCHLPVHQPHLSMTGRVFIAVRSCRSSTCSSWVSPLSEADQKSRTSLKGKSAPARGGKRSGNRLASSGGPTRDQLYNEARQRGT